MPTTALGPQRHQALSLPSYEGTHIFDLVQTAANLNRACRGARWIVLTWQRVTSHAVGLHVRGYYCMEAAAKGANFIMIGTKDHVATTSPLKRFEK